MVFNPKDQYGDYVLVSINHINSLISTEIRQLQWEQIRELGIPYELDHRIEFSEKDFACYTDKEGNDVYAPKLKGDDSPTVAVAFSWKYTPENT